MSNTYRKIEYTCYCGQDYGSCNSPGVFYLKYIGVSDVYVVLQKSHTDEKMQVVGWFGSESISALGTLLTKGDDDLASLTAAEIAELNEVVSPKGGILKLDTNILSEEDVKDLDNDR